MCMYELHGNDSQGPMSLVKGWDSKGQETVLQGFMLWSLDSSHPSLHAYNDVKTGTRKKVGKTQ